VAQLWSWIFSTDPFMPHGFCVLWRPDLVWTHVGSDAVIALAYFTIPVFLVTLLKRRRDIEFSWAFVAFATFILLCGATHVMNIVAFWVPVYGLEAVLKIGTAIASVATAVAVWPLLPKLLSIPSPHALKKINEELEQRVEARTGELRAVNEKLTVLLKELHHRVKNNLQIVAAMLRVKLRQIEDPAMKEALQRTINRVHAMGLVHQTLYADTNFSALGFGTYLEGLVDYLKRAHPRGDAVSVEVDADDSHFELDQSVPLALIANEIVTNALKHGVGDSPRGHIRIVLRSHGARTTLEIANSGGGSAPRRESGAGAGLQIVQALVTQLDGEAVSEPDGDGWRFRLSFNRSTAPQPELAPRPGPALGGLAPA
jgi:two-component sensor histidine kinase